jgi:site-specific recombinase XerD
MTIALKEGWIKELPWKRLYEHRKGGDGHFRISDKDRERLINYLKEMSPVNFWDLRDKAMMLLLLTYRLRKTEVSAIDIIDYDGGSIVIRTSMEWRNRGIEIDKSISEIIDSYLLKRRELKESLKEPALFIGLKRKRISPGMVNLILKELMNRMVKR